MINFVGKIKGQRRCPYVYFIIKGQYLYIGETQDLPIIRWSDHLNLLGSFSKNIRTVDEEYFDKNEDIIFIAYKCDVIYSSTKIEERKEVTRYIEHLLHIDTICNSRLGPKFILISDTSRTAPRSCKYSWASEVSKNIIESFIKELEASGVL